VLVGGVLLYLWGQQALAPPHPLSPPTTTAEAPLDTERGSLLSAALSSHNTLHPPQPTFARRLICKCSISRHLPVPRRHHSARRQSVFTCKCSRRTGSRAFSQARLPHVVEGAESASYQTGQELWLLAFMALGCGFACWIDKLSCALANQRPLSRRALVEVCMKGPSLLGFFHFVGRTAA